MVGTILIGTVLYEDYNLSQEFCEEEGYDGAKYGFPKSYCYENNRISFNSGQSLNISIPFLPYELPR
jgi:hypothetical protein